MLVRRRIELNPAYRNRQTFVRERGVEYRTISDIENGRRANYETATLAALEVAYELASGAIRHYVDHGGQLEPAPKAATRSASAELAAVPDAADDRITKLEVATLDLALERMLGEVRTRIRAADPGAAGRDIFPESRMAALFFDLDAVPLDEREDAIAVILLRDRQRQWQRSG